MEQESHVLPFLHGQFLLRSSRTFNNRIVTPCKATETIFCPVPVQRLKFACSEPHVNKQQLLIDNLTS